jgi:ring-1,2-phenylacetyl-CoA epoxidase subunit PaaD
MVTPEQRALMEAADVAQRPSLGAIWAALDAVPDPEIPVVSVIELGMVRAVEWSDADPELLVVRITPTYSGCPATDLIVDAVRDALHALGLTQLSIETQLSPPWSTDWMSPEAKRKLREFGIAPPADRDAGTTVDATAIGLARRPAALVSCPRCGSARTECIAQFGSTACKAQYRCLDCLEPFDYFKPH